MDVGLHVSSELQLQLHPVTLAASFVTFEVISKYG